MTDWPNDPLFKLGGIFGSIIIDHLFHVCEKPIFYDFCDIKKMTHTEIQNATLYCIHSDETDYLLHFITRADPDLILNTGAALHKNRYVDLGLTLKRPNGYDIDYNKAMVHAVQTGDAKWVKKFWDLGINDYQTDAYQNAMIMAVAHSHIELIKLIWEWDSTDVEEPENIDARVIIDALGYSKNPLEVIKVFDDLKLDFNFDSSNMNIQKWDHKTQIQMMYELKNRGYDGYESFCDGVVISGNIEGLRVLRDWKDMDYEYMFQLAADHSQIEIMKLVKGWGNFDEKIYSSTLDEYTAGNSDIVDLLISWGAKSKEKLPPGSRRRMIKT